MTTATQGKCDAQAVKPGDLFSRSSFGTVVRREYGSVVVKNDDGFEWSVADSVFEAEFTLADQAASETTCSQTDVISLIAKNPRTAMTIQFRKKPDAKDVTEKLRGFEGDLSSRKFRTFVGECLAGEQRVMVGRHYGDYDDRGRLQFIEHGKGLRLVDPRTVEFAIINNVKYTVA